MVEAPGQRLLSFLQSLDEATGWAVAEEATDQGSCWRLGGLRWNARIIVDPKRWIGLTFDLHDPATGRDIHYAIDTDLYPIDGAQDDFAGEIETDIVDFLRHLKDGAVLQTVDRGDSVLLIPKDAAFVRITRGRVLTSRDQIEQLNPDGDYSPVE